jgi:pyridoxine 4-dehydrogenase
MEPRRRVLGPVTVSRVGFGAIQLPGPGVFGPPHERTAAIAVVRGAVDPGLALVSKVGARRDASGGVLRYARPPELRQGIEDDLRNLAVGHLTVVNLHLMDGAPPGQYLDDRLAAVVAACEDGLSTSASSSPSPSAGGTPAASRS